MKRNHEIVVLHVGTSSLKTNKAAEEIAIEIINLAINLQNGDNKGIVSAVVMTQH